VGLAELHRILLRVAGSATDELIATARVRLGLGRSGDVVGMLAYAAVAFRIPMAEEDVEVLRSALVVAGDDGHLAGIHRLDRLGPLPCLTFSPHRPDRAVAGDGGDGLDKADVATIARDEDAAVQGVWRAWRSPGLDTVWPPPRRVFLVQASPPEALAVLAARWTQQLARAGEPSAQVEVFSDAQQLAPYQRAALASSTLLWARRGLAPLAVAPVFDPLVTTGGPGFGDTRPTLPAAARISILPYLDSGATVVASAVRMDDVLDRSALGVVPTGFRTYGTWVWSEATTHYLRRHGVAPDAALLEHIRTVPTPIAVDMVGLHRALDALSTASPPSLSTVDEDRSRRSAPASLAGPRTGGGGPHSRTASRPGAGSL
jgi:hypothetical protein